MASANEEAAMPTVHRHPIGVLRREFLQVGFSGLLGLGLSDLIAMRSRAAAASPGGSKPKPAAGSTPRAKSVILVFLTGGLSHIDSFDMKPDAPDGIRGEFKPIATAVPGHSVSASTCPCWPRVPIKLADRPVALARLYQPPERDP